MAKKNIEDEINSFLQLWDVQSMVSFLTDIEPLIKLFMVSEKEDWVRDLVGEDQKDEIRLLRSVYLMSNICDNHAGRMARIRAEFKGLADRMESTIMPG